MQGFDAKWLASRTSKRGSKKTQPAQPEARETALGKPARAVFMEREAKEGEIVFILPLPPKKLSPNARENWRYKGKAVKAYRQQCGLLMRAARVTPIDGRVVIDLEFYLCRVEGDDVSYYPKDEDNARASMKAAQDALKDAGIIAGDGKKNVGVGGTKLYTRAKEHRGFTCVVMTVREDR